MKDMASIHPFLKLTLRAAVKILWFLKLQVHFLKSLCSPGGAGTIFLTVAQKCLSIYSGAVLQSVLQEVRSMGSTS